MCRTLMGMAHDEQEREDAFPRAPSREEWARMSEVERIARLQEAMEWLRQRTDEEARRREEETRRLAESQAELERLKQRGG